MPDTDNDNDGTLDCNDNCPDDPNKTEPGICGCGTPDTNILPFDNGTWIIKRGSSEAETGIPEDPMTISLNGCEQGQQKILDIYHVTQDGSAFPLIVSLASSGYCRLRPGADGPPSNPTGPSLGTSAVLGPAFWTQEEVLYFNPQISTIEIDTSNLRSDGRGPLLLTAAGYLKNTDGNRGPLDVTYTILIPEPTDLMTTMKVMQTHTVTAPFTLSGPRMDNHEAFRVVQISSMFLNDTVHDSDGARYQNIDGEIVESFFENLGTLVFDSPKPMGECFVDSIHSDNNGFNDNSPNIRIQMNDTTELNNFTPQGFISSSSDPNNDNVGVWINYDAIAQSFGINDSRTFRYTLKATDNPIPINFIVGINYPWIKYGLDFGKSGFGHFGLSSDGSEGFRPQTYWNSQGITSCEHSQEYVHNGSYSLKALVNLQGQDPNRANGEIIVDLQDMLTVSDDFAANLNGKTISAWVYVPQGNGGPPSTPNFLQLFVKDASKQSIGLYDGTTNIQSIGMWYKLSLTVDPSTADYVGVGFDPTIIRCIGLKIGTNPLSTATINDPIYIDQIESPDPLVQFDFEQPSLAATDAARLTDEGVRVFRWFIFADGRAGIEYDENGFVTGLDDKFFDDFDVLISLAQNYNFRIIPVLFDYLLCADAEYFNGVQLYGHPELVQNPLITESFLNNALDPLLVQYGSSPEILYWEVMNEPEWALTGLEGVESPRSDVTVAEMQTFVSSVANFISVHHTSSAETKVTLGSGSDRWVSYWTNQGIDICQFHFYNCELHPDNNQPCLEYPNTFDFPSECLLGEFAAMPGMTDLTVIEYLQQAWINGYKGALPWSWRARDAFSPIAESDRVALLSDISEFVEQLDDCCACTETLLEALTKHAYWHLYSPYRENPGTPIDESQIRKELKMLYDSGARGLVTYEMMNGLERVPKIAKEIGFRWVIAGIYWWTNGTANGQNQSTLDDEKSNLEDQIQWIDGIVIGNEGLIESSVWNQPRYTITDLQRELQLIRTRYPDKPVTTAEGTDTYEKYSQLVSDPSLTDFVFPNIHPWWGGFRDPTQGVNNIVNTINSVPFSLRGDQLLVIHESWWPSETEGQDENTQETFFQELLNVDIPFCWGETIDQPWKGANEGSVGAHWGLWHYDRDSGNYRRKLVVDLIEDNVDSR
ncbi:MAG: glycoside hydrolase family 17 protein [Planctomycetota bacterium]